MNIQPLNNNYSASFKARLPKAEVKCLIQEAKQVPAGLPKLYTMLDFLDKTHTSYLNFIKHISDKSENYFLVNKNNTLGIGNNKFNALRHACVDNSYNFGEFSHMAQSAYEKQWQNNLDKTEKDILKFSLDA